MATDPNIPQPPPEIRKNIEKRYHLDWPAHKQYAHYMSGLIPFVGDKGFAIDLGHSMKRTQTVQEIRSEIKLSKTEATRNARDLGRQVAQAAGFGMMAGLGVGLLDGLSADEALRLVRGFGDGAGSTSTSTSTSRAAAPSAAGLSAASPLQVLGAEASGCTKCRLAGGRTQVVFGRGNPASDLVVPVATRGAKFLRQPWVE